MNKLKDQLVKETRGYMHTQSSECSKNSRIIAYGLLIINVIMIFQYPTFISLCSYCGLLGIILFLMIDIIHYYKDTERYYVELYRLNQYPKEEMLILHKRQMDKINKDSHKMFVNKHIVLILSMFLSIIGLLINLISIQQKTF